MATTNGKETIYIDIDDEITTIIEKVRASSEKIVALVLPKRASVLQSIVNMKLLKRTADQEKKRVVLITSENSLLPLAGTVGMYVAKTLQSKPEIPSLAGAAEPDEDILADEPDDDTEFTAENAGDRPVGELAGGAVPAAAASEGIETLQLDDDAEADESETKDTAADTPKPKKDKKLGVPNFERFRMLLIIGGVLLVALIIGGLVAATALPKASVTIFTDTTNVNSNLALTADTAAKTLDAAKLIVPAQLQKVDKTGSQQVPTTGKKNNGQKATGTVTFSTSCTKKPSSVDPGIGVSGSSHTFITTDSLKFTDINVDSGGNFVCSGSVPVVAQQGGADYNLGSGTTFKMATLGYTGTNSAAFTGGTDNIIQVVAQSDIDNATQKITTQNGDTMKQQLQQQLQQAGMFALLATFVAGTPSTQSSAQVGDQVGTVTVTQTTTYTMFGVKQTDLKTLVDNDIKDKIDPTKQTILDEGLSKATFKVNSATATSAQLGMATTATAGPDLKADDIKKQIAGKKAGEIKDMLRTDPGVTSVDVRLSPFWVTKVPSKASKVTVTFQKAK